MNWSWSRGSGGLFRLAEESRLGGLIDLLFCHISSGQADGRLDGRYKLKQKQELGGTHGKLIKARQARNKIISNGSGSYH